MMRFSCKETIHDDLSLSDSSYASLIGRTGGMSANKTIQSADGIEWRIRCGRHGS